MPKKRIMGCRCWRSCLVAFILSGWLLDSSASFGAVGIAAAKSWRVAIIVFGSLRKSLKGVGFGMQLTVVGKRRAQDGEGKGWLKSFIKCFVRCKSYGSVRVHRACGCVIGVPETFEPCSSVDSWWAETVDFASPRYRKCLVIIPPFFFFRGDPGNWSCSCVLLARLPHASLQPWPRRRR